MVTCDTFKVFFRCLFVLLTRDKRRGEETGLTGEWTLPELLFFNWLTFLLGTQKDDAWEKASSIFISISLQHQARINCTTHHRVQRSTHHWLLFSHSSTFSCWCSPCWCYIDMKVHLMAAFHMSSLGICWSAFFSSSSSSFSSSSPLAPALAFVNCHICWVPSNGALNGTQHAGYDWKNHVDRWWKNASHHNSRPAVT